jgi:hypothetical protein
MAKVKQGKQALKRVSFRVPFEVWLTYRQNNKRSSKIKCNIDYDRDFGLWLNRQNKQVTEDLNKLQKLYETQQEIVKQSKKKQAQDNESSEATELANSITEDEIVDHLDHNLKPATKATDSASTGAEVKHGKN